MTIDLFTGILSAMNQHDPSRPLSRRDFLKLTGLGLGTLALRPWTGWLSARERGLFLPEFPATERLGRNCVGKVDLRVWLMH